MITPVIIKKLHQGIFSKVHEKWSSKDNHLKGDNNITRLRVYYAYSFAKIAIANTSNGEFLNTDISYNTAPLVINELLKEKIKGEVFIL